MNKAIAQEVLEGKRLSSLITFKQKNALLVFVKGFVDEFLHLYHRGDCGWEVWIPSGIQMCPTVRKNFNGTVFLTRIDAVRATLAVIAKGFG